MLNPQDVRQLATLARIALDDAEVEQLRSQLSDILEHFQRLQNVDTEGISPTGHSTVAQSVMRIDEIEPSLLVDDTLSNAPVRHDDFFRVRAVLDTN
jgi:aspartyl-tRNA(Asn)/glutamyl-tRNA(Gln) amidotransferase subunit C